MHRVLSWHLSYFLAFLLASCTPAQPPTGGGTSVARELAPVAEIAGVTAAAPDADVGGEVPAPEAEGDPSSPYVRASQQPTFVRWPEEFWAKNYRATMFWSGPDANATSYAALPQWSWLEFRGEQRNGRLRVRYPGDGRLILPREGWVSTVGVMVAPSPTETEIPRAYPATTQPGAFRLNVPYRTQLDGSAYEAANCGPTSLGMALESVGVNVPSGQLRNEVLEAQGLRGDDIGVYMEALVRVGEGYGARVLDFSDGRTLRHWSVDDVRTQVRAGRPVILQVLFRGLPGREERPYYGDHFVVITGLIGDSFLYNDPIDSDGIGFDRLMTASQLDAALNASDRKYAHAGFALAAG